MGRDSDIPIGAKWGSKSSSHRWLKRWMKDGTLTGIQSKILELAELKGKLR